MTFEEMLEMDELYIGPGRTLDPLGYYAVKGIPERKIKEALGFLPGFIVPGLDMPIKEQLEANYPGGVNWMEFHNDTSDFVAGLFLYKGDPDQYPLWKLSCPESSTRLYQYPNGIVVRIEPDGKMQWTRMD